MENDPIVGEQNPWRNWTSWQQGKQRESRNRRLTWENNQSNVTGGVSREKDKAGMTGDILTESKDKETREG